MSRRTVVHLPYVYAIKSASYASHIHPHPNADEPEPGPLEKPPNPLLIVPALRPCGHCICGQFN